MCPRCRARAPAASGLQAAGRCPKDGAFFVSERALARSDGDPLLGCTLGGRFAVLALRARGARASVYDSRVVPAAPEGAGRPTTAPIASAVLKVVRCDGPRSEAALALAWEGEVQRLASAAVAPGWLGQGCSEVGDEPRFAAFVASERAPGASLAEPSEQSFLERATRAARALAALHAAGIVHGDLTPEHVFVDAQRSAATFVDFGSAALDAGGGGERARLSGATPAYAAPELWETGPTRAADVYALGCVLVRMVTGRPPFSAASLEGLRAAHRSAAPPPLPDAVGAALGSTIAAALSKSAGHRPPDGAALVRALEA